MSALNPNHPMSDFATENAVKFLGLMIWKLRRHCPNLAVEIGVADMQDFERAFMHGGQTPVVAFTGKRESVVLQLVDQATGKMLIADKTKDENSPNAKTMRRMLEARKRAQSVADRLLAGNPDKALLADAAEILKLLTWEPAE